METIFSEKNHAVINYANSTVPFYDGLVILPLQGFNSLNNCACIHKTICIPGYSEILAPVRLSKNYRGSEAILEPLATNLTKVLIGGSLTAIKNGIGMLRLLNFYPQPITLKKNLLVASVTFPSQVAAITPFKNPADQPPEDTNSKNPITEKLEKFVKEYKFDLCNNLTTKQRRELMLVLYKYKDIFARTIEDIKTYPNFELKLQPKSWDVKCYTRQYKLPQNEADEAHEQILSLCSRGLISESTDTTYNSAVFMVKKRDGSLRLVCDLRRINILLRPFVIQMPKIDDILNGIALQNPHIIFTFDMYKGYFSVKLNRKTNNLTAFCSPKTGQSYSRNVLPMGLSVSAGAFVKVINQLFQDKEKFPYLWYCVDDLAVSSRTFAEHVTHLNAVFNTFRQNMFTINPTKTRIGCDELEFLEHTVSANGVRISDLT